MHSYLKPSNVREVEKRYVPEARSHFKEPTIKDVGATSRRPLSQRLTQKKQPQQAQSQKEKENAPIFEIFGIKLYFDDLLIIALLFFLYEEGVEDNLLFISLILLLLS